jgi:HEAT repeat protein
VHHAAAVGLNGLRPLPESAAPPLCNAITDVEPAARVKVAAALGHLHLAESVAPLVRATQDVSRGVRFEAMRSLSELGFAGISDETAAVTLACVLKREEDPYVAYEAYWALWWQGGSAMSERLSAFRRSEWGRNVWLVAGRA